MFFPLCRISRCQCFICHLTGYVDYYWLGLDQEAEKPLQVKLDGLMLDKEADCSTQSDAIQAYFMLDVIVACEVKCLSQLKNYIFI